jgi:HK97 family phage prohead protease
MGVDLAKADFSGYATKAGLECADGRTITAEAFKHMDGAKVPLVWQHGHNSPDNVLGHVYLKARDDGMYCYAFLNDSPQGKNAKTLVTHGDVDKLSIWANQLVEKLVKGTKSVLHGMIREVSLVISGANPGALIDFVTVQHSDDPDDRTTLTDEAFIYTGLQISHGAIDNATGEDQATEVLEHATNDPTLQTVWDGLDAQQKDLVQYLIGEALNQNAGSSMGQSDTGTTEGGVAHQEGTDENMGTRNTFESAAGNGTGTGTVVATGTPASRHVIAHSDIKAIFTEAKRLGSLRAAVENYASDHLEHGIDDIDVLFPEARTIGDTPEFNSRRMEWVAAVLNGTKHSPFSRIKTRSADITMAEARAKGYVKGAMKKEEFFSVTKRTTGPTTVYKKQKLDRDDIIDITDFDVVAWMKGEMRLMLEEELARAILFGDGRAVDDEDKISDPAGASSGDGIRSILNDHELYAQQVEVNITDASSSYTEVIETVLLNMGLYKGSGSPTFYTTLPTLTQMLLLKDTLGRRLYSSKADVALAMGVGNIVTCEILEDSVAYPNVVGVIVNLIDYNIGADKGGEINLFDQFDIDFNQEKYLIETRLSGALTKLKSALIVTQSASTDVLVHPVTSPTFDAETGVVTIPTQTHVVYKNADTGATLSAGAQTALAAGDTLAVVAEPASGYYFQHTWYWSFTRNSE